ncbi:MAG TPA: ATP-binding protein, partial [Anaerolineales bacterium]
TQADPNQIKQVLFNLVHNALQAMSPGGRLIVSTAHQPYESQSGVTVSVKDSGKGISFEDQQRIFDPFYTTLPVGEGTGLGLAVSYGIVKEHGGHIDVDSQVGVGSCFTVWLPLAFEEEHV